MRADEQADICQSEDGEGILVDPVHALPNLKALPPSCFVRLPQRSQTGLGGSVFRLSPSFTIPHGTTNRIQVQPCSIGTPVTFALDLLILPCNSFLDSRAVWKAERFTQSTRYGLRSFGEELTTIRNAGGVSCRPDLMHTDSRSLGEKPER